MENLIIAEGTQTFRKMFDIWEKETAPWCLHMMYIFDPLVGNNLETFLLHLGVR
jgi:hypothetical protein